MIRACSSLSPNRFRLLKGYPAASANVQVSYMLTEPTLQEHIGPGCAGEESQHGSHATASSHAKNLANGVGTRGP